MAPLDFVKGMFAQTLASKQAKKIQREEARKTPAMRQHEYAVARQSILGEFASQPITGRQRCITEAKAARRQERLDLVDRAIAACPKHAAQAARLRADMDEVENMRCAKHVYLANDRNAPVDLRDNPPPGFKIATPQQLEAMGLDDDLLKPRGSNFRAAVYIKDPQVWGPHPDPEAVLAFRGSTPEKEDWDNNFAQDANNNAPYYERAVNIGSALRRQGASVHFVGHSLGGGTASAAQGASGFSASTYNAAGLNPETVKNYSTDKGHEAAEPAKINAIRVSGEVLTKKQETGFTGMLASKAVGYRREIAPSHDEHYFKQLQHDMKVLPTEEYDTYLHGMDEVISSMEKSKVADEAALQHCIGRSIV